MSYAFIQDFLSSYGLSSVVTGSAISILCFLLNKLFKEKFSLLFKLQIPFILSITAHFVYDMVFVSHAFIFTEKAFAAGILGGSFAIIINSFVSKIKRGEFIGLSATTLLIEGFLDGLVSESCLASTAIAVESIILEHSKESEKEEIIREIIDIIKLNSDKDILESDIEQTAIMILHTVSSL